MKRKRKVDYNKLYQTYLKEVNKSSKGKTITFLKNFEKVKVNKLQKINAMNKLAFQITYEKEKTKRIMEIKEGKRKTKGAIIRDIVTSQRYDYIISNEQFNAFKKSYDKFIEIINNYDTGSAISEEECMELEDFVLNYDIKEIRYNKIVLDEMWRLVNKYAKVLALEISSFYGS